jgi:predicted ATPase
MQPEPPSIIIIDEPEIGLHPYALSLVAAMIRSVSTRSQVIVATQSPALVSEFQPEDIIVVDYENNQSAFRRYAEKDLSTWLEDYSLGEIWEKNVIGGTP